MTNELQRANDIAAQLALMALVRLLVGNACYSDDRAKFRRNLAMLEARAIDFIAAQDPFPQANEATRTYITEASSAWISRALSGIVHPADRESNNPG